MTFHILLKAMVLPPAGPLLLGIMGLFFWWRRPGVGLALCAASTLSLWILATPIIADALMRASERYPALDYYHLSPSQARAQAIVILGEGYRGHAPEVGRDVPSVTADLALLEAARIARATHLPLLVSGTERETGAMRAFLADDLLRPPHWLESGSSNTHENALFTARLLKPQGIDRIILVTSSVHMLRSVEEFTAAGFQVTPAPAGMFTHDDWGVMAYVPSLRALSRSHDALYEWCGRLVRGFSN